MICYRDMTFCHYFEECLDGDTCPRALTKEVNMNAAKWWGGCDAPICLFVDKPSCFKYEYIKEE